jgi:GNAT superfamily N-acetyltransferase
VAEAAGEVAGWLHAATALRLESPPYAEIGGLVVEERRRGQGIGERLVRAAIGWAGERGYAELRVRSNVVRADAHRFYRRLGFASVKTQAVFALPLGER